jgi:predicted dehydrogenase
LRVAVVGCGYWGSKHVRILHGIPQVEQVIAVDSCEDRLLSLKYVFPDLEVHRALDPALAVADAVIIATPPKSHAPLALTALDAGKSVLVEKPLATSTAEACQMIEEASARSLVLMVGHTFEYNAAVWKLRELVQTGELGRLHYIDSARLNLGLYQSDVNVIWDLAPHDVSILNYVLGAKPTSVQAWGARHGHRFLEDVAYLRLLYPDQGMTANIHVSWLDPYKVRRMTVVGSDKMAVYNDLAAEERIRIFDKGIVMPADEATMQEMPMSYRYGDIRSPYLPFDEPLGIEDREFVASVAEGRQPRTDGLNGLAVVQVLEGANISLEEGRLVDLDELSEVRYAERRLVEVS